MFANIFSGKFSNHCSSKIILVEQEGALLDQVFHNWIIMHKNTLKTCWISSSNFFEDECGPFRSFLFKSPISMQMQNESSKQTKIVLVLFSRILFVN